MPIANIDVAINEEEIKQHINQRLDDMIRESLIMIDVPTLSKKMCLSTRFLEDVVLCDVRIKAIERKKVRKRLYFYDELIPVLKEVIYEKF